MAMERSVHDRSSRRQWPASVALGDLNGDGMPGMAVANTGSDSLSVLLGNGNGSLLLATNIAVDKHS